MVHHLVGSQKRVDFNPDQYKPPRDAAQKVVDGAVQVTKFIAQLLDPHSAGLAFLELVGADALKDGIKGGNSDETVEALRKGFDVLKDSLNGLIDSMNTLSDAGKEQIKDALTTLTSLRNAGEGAWRHFLTAQRHFNEAFKAVTAKIQDAKKGKTGKTNPQAQKVLGVFRAVNDAWNARQQAVNAISGGRQLSDTRFWKTHLVPLGELIFDGRDSRAEDERRGYAFSKEGSSVMVYAVGAKQIVFYLPGSGLSNSFEDLSKWVGLAHKITTMPDDGLDQMHDDWSAAMVDGL